MVYNNHCPESLQARWARFTLLVLVAWSSLVIGSLKTMEIKVETAENVLSDKASAVRELVEIASKSEPDDFRSLQNTYSKSPVTLQVPPVLGSEEIGKNSHFHQSWMKFIENAPRSQFRTINQKDFLIERLEAAHSTLLQAESKLLDNQAQLAFFTWIEKNLKEEIIRYLKFYPETIEISGEETSERSRITMKKLWHELSNSAQAEAGSDEIKKIENMKQSNLSPEAQLIMFEFNDYKDEYILKDKYTELVNKVKEGSELEFLKSPSDAFGPDRANLFCANDLLLVNALKSTHKRLSPRTSGWLTSFLSGISPWELKIIIENWLASLFDKLISGKSWTIEEKKLLKLLNQKRLRFSRKDQWYLLYPLASEQLSKNDELLSRKKEMFEDNLASSLISTKSHSSAMNIPGQPISTAPKEEKQPDNKKTFSLSVLKSNRHFKKNLHQEFAALASFVNGQRSRMEEIAIEIGSRGRLDLVEHEVMGILQNLKKEEFSIVIKKIEQNTYNKEDIDQRVTLLIRANQRHKINTGRYTVEHIHRLLNFLDGSIDKKTYEFFSTKKRIQVLMENLSILELIKEKIALFPKERPLYERTESIRVHFIDRFKANILKWHSNEFDLIHHDAHLKNYMRDKFPSLV